jgi:hypothetical protein
MAKKIQNTTRGVLAADSGGFSEEWVVRAGFADTGSMNRLLLLSNHPATRCRGWSRRCRRTDAASIACICAACP